MFKTNDGKSRSRLTAHSWLHAKCGICELAIYISTNDLFWSHCGFILFFFFGTLAIYVRGDVCQLQTKRIGNHELFASHYQNASLHQGMSIELVKMLQTYASKIEIRMPLNHFEALANVGKAIFVSYKFRYVHFMTSFFLLFPISTSMLNWLLDSTPTQHARIWRTHSMCVFLYCYWNE